MGMYSGPSCLVCPSFSIPGSAEANARAQETLVPRDSKGQEAHRACSEWLWLQRLKR
jgi:hypothetical protein